jgi:hypothetical protein
MSLTLIAAVAAAVAASIGYLSARRSHGEENAGDGARPAPPPRHDGSGGVLAELPLALGDVVMAGDEERWLSGAIVAQESGDHLVAVIFVAPEGAQLGAVVVFPPPRRDIDWLAPASVDSPGEPPATLEIAGTTMQRRGRLPAALRRIGQGAPPIGEAGIVAMYDGGGSDVAVVLGSAGHVHAWAGRRIDEDGYERLGGGGTGE